MGYEVEYVLNITDVDDKIILRARRNHLVRPTAPPPAPPHRALTFVCPRVLQLAEFERESLARKLTPETLQDAALLALGTFAEM